MAISKSTAKSPRLSDPEVPESPRPQRISMGGYSIPVPGSRILRIALGIALVIGGLLGFLPILGFWMLPLGLFVLSIDLKPARRLRRRLEVWWGRRKQTKNNR